MVRRHLNLMQEFVELACIECSAAKQIQVKTYCRWNMNTRWYQAGTYSFRNPTYSSSLRPCKKPRSILRPRFMTSCAVRSSTLKCKKNFILCDSTWYGWVGNLPYSLIALSILSCFEYTTINHHIVGSWLICWVKYYCGPQYWCLSLNNLFSVHKHGWPVRQVFQWAQVTASWNYSRSEESSLFNRKYERPELVKENGLTLTVLRISLSSRVDCFVHWNVRPTGDLYMDNIL